LEHEDEVGLGVLGTELSRLSLLWALLEARDVDPLAEGGPLAAL